MFARLTKKNSAQFETVAEMADIIETLPTFSKVPLFGHPEKGDAIEFTKLVGIMRDPKPGATASRPSVIMAVPKNTELPQPKEMGRAVTHALAEHGIENVRGSIVSNDAGTRIDGVLLLVDREFDTGPTPGAAGSSRSSRVGEVFQIGVKWTWSIEGKHLHVGGWVSRVSCSNGRVTPQTMGDFSVTLTGNVTGFLADFPRYLDEILAGCVRYGKQWMEADAEVIAGATQPALLLRAAGLPATDVSHIITRMYELEPRTAEHLSRATLFEAASAYLNHHDGSSSFAHSTTKLEKLGILIENSVEKVLEAMA